MAPIRCPSGAQLNATPSDSVGLNRSRIQETPSQAASAGLGGTRPGYPDGAFNPEVQAVEVGLLVGG